MKTVRQPLSMQQRQQGFTLLEIIMVLVILGGLMAIIGPRVFGGADKANVNKAKIMIEQLSGSIDMYKLDTSKLPENLGNLVTAPSGVNNWNGPYVKAEMLKDPWSNDFKYSVQGSKVDIISLGADGKEGGTGADQDIRSTN